MEPIGLRLKILIISNGQVRDQVCFVSHHGNTSIIIMKLNVSGALPSYQRSLERCLDEFGSTIFNNTIQANKSICLYKFLCLSENWFKLAQRLI